MTDEEDLPEVAFAEYPQRICRRHQTPDGLVDHFCGLPDLHPGPCCPRTLRDAIKRRQAWEKANEGWEKTARQDDPFKDITRKGGV